MLDIKWKTQFSIELFLKIKNFSKLQNLINCLPKQTKVSWSYRIIDENYRSDLYGFSPKTPKVDLTPNPEVVLG